MLMATLTQALLALAATLALMLGAVWLIRRFGPQLGLPLLPVRPSKQTPRLKHLETLRLSPTLALHLVRLDDTEHLIAASGTHVSNLGSPAVQQPPSSQPSQARKVLRK
jgi:flagellar biogenesis protein FliO